MTYDENGNMISVTNSCGTTTYDWDARNRLVAISGFDALCSPLSAAFKYDALGRRIEKTINGKTIQYLYDGLDIVQQIENGVVSANYFRTLNIDEPLARIKADGTVRYYQTDALGSIIALTDAAGTIRTQYTYDPYGNVTITGEPSDNPFQYTGRENDGTGLYYYRFRYYSPELQRFLSEDPIGFAGGDVNLMNYVGADPVNYLDPLGLEADSPYGSIRNAPGFPQTIIDDLYTAYYSFMHEDGPRSRLDVFMKYESIALELGSGAGVGKRCLVASQSSRWFRKYIFTSFPSELGRGYSLFGGRVKFMTHHVRYHGHHMQIELFGKVWRPIRPKSWNPLTWVRK
jgi:RHS repeat-associated protein